MKMTKWLAVGVLVLLVAGVVNSIFGLIESPSILGDNAMKGGDSSSARPWWEAREENPIRNLPESDQSGLLVAIKKFEKSGNVPADMSQLIQTYRTLNQNRYAENPWYLFLEGVGYLLLEDSQTFETISGRLFSMETLTSDHLCWMGWFLDSYGFHDYAWSYDERSIRQYVLEGNSVDDDNVMLPNLFFLPMQSFINFLAEGKSQTAVQRLNALIKLNPRIENMYWFYMQMARYYDGEGMKTLAPQLEKLAAKQLQGATNFNPRTIVNGDYYTTGMAVTLFMFLVYIVALRFKYHGIARDARQKDGNVRKNGGRRFFSLRHSPYYYLRPGEFVFLLAMVGLFLVLSANVKTVLLSVGRGASAPQSFASGRFGLSGSKQVLANLKAEYGDRTEFKRFYAYSLAQSGDYDTARTELEQVLDEDNDDVSALVNLAVIEYREGNDARAGRLIDRAVELAPACLEAVHNYRVITGRMIEFPEWFQRLKESENIETTVRIVNDYFDAIWPNAMAVASGGNSETLFMSDHGRFLVSWTKEPLTLRSRVISLLENARLAVNKTPFRFLGEEVPQWIWIVPFVGVGIFCVVFIQGAGHQKEERIRRCAVCGKVFRESCTDEMISRASTTGDNAPLCSVCARNARYDDHGFINGGFLRWRTRWVPFVGAFREGRLVTATISLMLFLFCMVSFVFANSSILGVCGATGYLSSVAIPRISYTPLTESFSMHYAAAYSVVLVSGMVVSIVLSLIAALPRAAHKRLKRI